VLVGTVRTDATSYGKSCVIRRKGRVARGQVVGAEEGTAMAVEVERRSERFSLQGRSGPIFGLECSVVSATTICES
jgi:hypothetical protein